MGFLGLNGREERQARRHFFSELVDLRKDNLDMPEEQFKSFAIDHFRSKYEALGIDVEKLEQILKLLLEYLPLILALFKPSRRVPAFLAMLIVVFLISPAIASANETAKPSMFAAAESIEAAEAAEFEAYYATLEAPLDQDGNEVAERSSQDGEWVTETYMTTECVGGVCRPVQRTRQVWRAAAGAFQASTNAVASAAELVPRPRNVVRGILTRRPVRTWLQNRPRLFGRFRCR